MARKKSIPDKSLTEDIKSRPIKAATSVESQENRMISLAVDLAEKQLREGTASTQVIVHYLKLGSTKEQLEREILEKQKDLMVAKTEALQSAKQVEELYKSAIAAFRSYNGQSQEESYDDQDIL